jgi:hypothetical protein
MIRERIKVQGTRFKVQGSRKTLDLELFTFRDCGFAALG